MSELTVARLSAIYNKFIKRAAYMAFAESEMTSDGLLVKTLYFKVEV